MGSENNKLSKLFGLISRLWADWLLDFKGVGKKGTFIQNFAFAFTSNFLYIIIQFIAAPILSRIYSPEAYGLFGIFNAIVTNLAMVATMTYPNAIVLPKDKNKAITLIQLSLIMVITISLLSFFAILLWGDLLLHLINSNSLGFLKYLIPPGILIVGTNQIVSQWIIREKEFMKSLQFGPPTSILIKATNIGFGWITHGAAYGLVIVDFAGKYLGLAINSIFVLRNKLYDIFTLPRKKDLTVAAREYYRYPLYVFPGNYVNTLSSQLPVYFLSIYFGNVSLGYFAFAASLLDMPMRLLGNAVSPVFFQKANEVYHDNPGELGKVARKLFNRLLIVGILPFSFISVFGDKIFEILFGMQWTTAGEFAGYMSIYYFFRLISGPISSIFNIMGKERILLRFQVFFVLFRLAALIVGVMIFKNHVATILVFSIASAIAYLILNLMVFNLVQENAYKVFAKSIMITGIGLGTMFLLRMLLFK